jgi:hypothetical protein
MFRRMLGHVNMTRERGKLAFPACPLRGGDFGGKALGNNGGAVSAKQPISKSGYAAGTGVK